MIVIIGSGKGTSWIKNILNNTIKREDSIFVNQEEELIHNAFIRGFYKLLNHKKTRFLMEFLRPLFFKSITSSFSKDTHYLVQLNWNSLSYDKRFLGFIRKEYPDCKTILLLTASMDTSKKFFLKYCTSLSEVINIFDFVCSFDKKDCKLFGLTYIPLMYGGIDCSQVSLSNEYDLCYVGSAKNRLSFIHEIYNELSNKGLKLVFYVNGVGESDMKYSGIVYNQRLSYEQTISISAKSKCIMEIIEEGQSFSTIRLGESIFLNKKLLTNNVEITHSEYYDKNYIITTNSEIDRIVDFIHSPIAYAMHPKVSLMHEIELIRYLEKTLNK